MHLLDELVSWIPLWQFVYFIWGSVAIHQSQGSRHQCSNLWGFGVTSVVLTALLGNAVQVSVAIYQKKTNGSVAHAPGTALMKENEENAKANASSKSSATKTSRIKKVVYHVGTLAPSIIVTLIWGLVIYTSITDECKALYQNQFPKLWTWFLAAVWSSVGLTGLILLTDVSE